MIGIATSSKPLSAPDPLLITPPGSVTVDRPLASGSPGTGKTIILGLGNDILSDDAVGLLAARRIAHVLFSSPSVDVFETTEMGLALLDFLTGYQNAIIIDSIQTSDGTPGQVHEWDAASVRTEAIHAPHFLGLPDTLSLGLELGLTMPGRVAVLCVEVADPFTLGTQLTPLVEAALPQVVERALALATVWPAGEFNH